MLSMSLALGGLLVASASQAPVSQLPEQTHAAVSQPCAEVFNLPGRRQALAGYQAWRQIGSPRVEAVDYAEGAKRSFLVYNFETQMHDSVPATLLSVGDYSYVWVADDQLGPAKVTATAAGTIAAALDEQSPAGSWDPALGIVPLERSLFGEPPDVDGTGKVHALIVDIQDSWTDGCGCGYVAGFFDPLDLSPDDPDSNHMDLLYIDAQPGVYRPDEAPSPERVLGTVAHEYQHLIHASYGALNLFQNEGQSEWATSLAGYGERTPQYLNVPEELGTALFSWRYGDASYDYQRAGLLHGWLAQRVGVEPMARLTQSAVVGTSAYEAVLSAAGLDWGTTLLDFHMANWLDDPSVGAAWSHTGADIAVLRPTVQHITGAAVPETTRELAFGAVDYIQWFGVQGFELDLTAGPALGRWAILEAGGVTQTRAVAGRLAPAGDWDSITLVVANPQATGDEVQAPGSQSYTYSASWVPTGATEELLSHYNGAELAYFVALPRTEDQTAQAVRFSPTVTGQLNEVVVGLHRFLDGSPNPEGAGVLRISLASSTLASGDGPDAVYAPGAVRAHIDVPLEELAPGLMNLKVSGAGWSVIAGEDLQLVFEVVGDSDAKVYFDLDTGSSDTRHPDYYPARTRRWSEAGGSWDLTWSDHGNIVALARVFGQAVTAPLAPAPRYPADGDGDVALPVRLAWYPQTGAVLYDLQLAADAQFLSPVVDVSGLSEVELAAPDLALGSRWYWRVRGVGAAGTGAWSAPQSFTVRSATTNGEVLSYINPAEIYWAVSLPFGTETRWATRFTPYAEGQIEAVWVDLADLAGLENPTGTGALSISLYSSAHLSGEGIEAVYQPDALLGQTSIALARLSPGRNIVDVSDQGWLASPLEDLFVVIEVDGDGGVTLDLDNGAQDTVNVDYYPVRTLRYLEDANSWGQGWLYNGNIGLSLDIAAGESAPQTLSYFEPSTLYWYGSLPYGTETAWSVRVSPTGDGVLTGLDLGLTSFYDGSANPWGAGRLRVSLAPVVSEGGEGPDEVLVPGEPTQSLVVDLSAVRSSAGFVSLPSWSMTQAEDVFVILEVEGVGGISLNVDDGSADRDDPRYYPARSRRYVSDQGGWQNTWLNNGNFELSVVVEAEPSTGGCGGGRRAASGAWAGLALLLGLAVRRRRP